MAEAGAGGEDTGLAARRLPCRLQVWQWMVGVMPGYSSFSRNSRLSIMPPREGGGRRGPAARGAPRLAREGPKGTQGASAGDPADEDERARAGITSPRG